MYSIIVIRITRHQWLCAMVHPFVQTVTSLFTLRIKFPLSVQAWQRNVLSVDLFFAGSARNLAAHLLETVNNKN